VSQRTASQASVANVVRAARIAQALVADGIRHWAATGPADRHLAETLAQEISTLLLGPEHH
jgi:hypothetical protein